MTERQLQFRVGLFVIVAVAAMVAMVFEFGELQSYLKPKYTVTIRFRSGAGISVSTPVRRNGVMVGAVKSVQFDDEHGGVVVQAAINESVRLWADGGVRLSSTLLGDTSIEFVPGRGKKFLKDGDAVDGEAASDPLSAVGRIEQTASTAIESFQETSREWQTVGRNLNHLLQTNEGNLHTVVARAAESLSQVTRTLKLMDQTLVETSRIVADPQTQASLKKTLASLPELTAETQRTVEAVRAAVEKTDENLRNLGAITAPFSKRSVTLATRLENTLTNLETLSEELAQFSKAINSGGGSIRKLATDPQLYVNLNRSAESMTVLLRNLEPIVRDMRVFSDKVARHPEIIGVSGALRGSSGLKDPEEAPVERVGGGPRRLQRE